MNFLRALFLGFSCLMLSLFPPPASGTESASAAGVVEGFHAALLDTMKNADSLGVTGRFEKLAPAMDAAFDFTTMIRVAATRRFWNVADESQRKDLLESFRRLSIATYAAQFNGFSGQRFATVGEKPGPQGTILVATKIVDPDDSDVGLTYVLKETDSGGRKIADVLLDDSISQLAVRRSEYSNILRKSGISALITELTEKSEKILGGS